MGRACRIEYEGALYHILSRGNEQGDVFYDNTDRGRFLDTIGELSERFAADYRWSSYLAYGYGKSKPDWLSTKLILSQFEHEDAHKQYREKVQKYSQEEKRLWEDFRHGLFLGSKGFVTGLRKQHMPEKAVKSRLAKEHKFRDFIEDLNSQFKV